VSLRSGGCREHRSALQPASSVAHDPAGDRLAPCQYFLVLVLSGPWHQRSPASPLRSRGHKPHGGPPRSAAAIPSPPPWLSLSALFPLQDVGRPEPPTICRLLRRPAATSRQTVLLSSAAMALSKVAITSACVRRGSSFQSGTGRTVCHSSALVASLTGRPSSRPARMMAPKAQ
jgi:hypothetical protein